MPILNTKIQNVFCCVNENLTTFLYTLNSGEKKTEVEKKLSFWKCIKMLNVILKNVVFIFGIWLIQQIDHIVTFMYSLLETEQKWMLQKIV